MSESKKKINNNEIIFRHKKLIELRKETNIVFPNNFKINISLDKIYKKYNHKNIFLEKKSFNIAGRIVNLRIMGKASFINIQDYTGNIQIYISQKEVSQKIYKNFLKKYDIGDIIGVTGYLFKTKINVLSIFCQKIYLLTKAIRSLPDKYHGLQDKEIKYRKRYLDLIVNKKTRYIFKKRSKIILNIRNFMNERDFIEVETPMMHNIPGGALARPFVTYHNTYNKNIYLRIAPELYLKRLIIGGFNKIFEINRNFRNEGISTKHNPEFTMMELYITYCDYKDLMIFFEKFFKKIYKKIFKKYLLKYNNYVFDLNKKFHKLTMKESIIYFYPNFSLDNLEDNKKLVKIANLLKVNINPSWSQGKIIFEIFEKKIVSKIIEPTFITEYPTEISPLSRNNNLNPLLTDRFEFFICGMEIANGFSELNDPEEQKKRFKEQQNIKNMSDNKIIYKNFYDQDYIEALEYGLPPTAGLGIGIDRLVMLFTDTQSIRDVILFPMLRTIE
ncbi:lysine--tRNA ligase [Enterobacteriaceae endosymbiont of Donacia bicoloricornis]|uniref:lysine--tRNA ligase n=1 Tax=Enterobacteriaceae endosymbiont of Donacia bicoloricornis TaxID=2675772 RepID=UPI001449073D|nr:lysine--tRNA ligase [Enterobacteriaceae endosymbiont of Donacia bicoloricornis]QJC37722.1 lysine--tRNA ligase [Enterobacteriaceae endosymbiont of Donacia bicoloricornis]